MRNRIADYVTDFEDDRLDHGPLDERAAMEFARWTPSQRRLRRMFARMQRRRMRRLLRMHAAVAHATEGARGHAETPPEDERADRRDSTGLRPCAGDGCRGGSRDGVDRIRGGCRHGDIPRGSVEADAGRTSASGDGLTAYHDRQPGDAEAAGAAAAMAEDSGFQAGDIVAFSDPARGFEWGRTARVVNVLPSGQLCIETVIGRWELVIDQAQVISRASR